MPQSLSQVIVHIVFSTKERRPWLDPDIRPRMHGYLATVCRDCDCQAYRVGRTADHVHIAARLARTVSQAELLEKIKKTSSSWIKEQGNQYAGRLRRFFHRLESVGGVEVHRSPGSSSSHPDVPGRVPWSAGQIPRRIRRKIRLGLKESLA